MKEAEEVTLVGTFVQEYSDHLTPGARRDLQWLGESLLLVREQCVSKTPTEFRTARGLQSLSHCSAVVRSSPFGPAMLVLFPHVSCAEQTKLEIECNVPIRADQTLPSPMQAAPWAVPLCYDM